MQDEYLRELKVEFDRFEEAFGSKGGTEKENPRPVLDALEKLGYAKNTLSSALEIDPLTIDRWRSGNSMKGDKFSDLKRLVEDVLNGKSRFLIGVSDTGFVAWEYIFKLRQPLATRIWYISEDRFLLKRSKVIREEVWNLFDVQTQKTIPTMVYVFPKNSDTENHLAEWINKMHRASLANPDSLRGTVICLKMSDRSPWFFSGVPGMRTIILEIEGKLEGYVRIRVPGYNEEKILRALGETEAEGEQRPWLCIHPQAAELCYDRIDEEYSDDIKEVLRKQQEKGLGFYYDLVDVSDREVRGKFELKRDDSLEQEVD